jgi:hypothetical protein
MIFSSHIGIVGLAHRPAACRTVPSVASPWLSDIVLCYRALRSPVDFSHLQEGRLLLPAEPAPQKPAPDAKLARRNRRPSRQVNPKE